jgi:hypothetical protein
MCHVLQRVSSNPTAHSSQSPLTYPRPELTTQANVDPSTAAQDWKVHIEPLKNKGYQLIAPSVTCSDVGYKWLQTFLNNCKTCTVGVIFVISL